MVRIRSYIALLLIAVLTLTGQSMAIARGMPASVGMMELCTGDQLIMVEVDAQGQPTGSSHICPEFTLMLADALAPVAVELAALSGTRSCCLPWVQISAMSRSTIWSSARAPPFHV